MKASYKGFLIALVVVMLSFPAGAQYLLSSQVMNQIFDDDTNSLRMTLATGFSDDLTLENGEIISNSTDGTVAITATATTVSGTLASGGAVDFGGDLTLENDETISNSSDGTVAITATATTVSGTLASGGAVDFAGDITLENDETISNSTNGTVAVDGAWSVAPGTTGGLTVMAQEVLASITADASITVDLTIPNGSYIVGVQYQVESALAATETWDASFNDGAELWEFADDIAVALNTEGSAFWPITTVAPVTDADTNIIIDGNGATGAFTAQGSIRFIVYYYDFGAMADAS